MKRYIKRVAAFLLTAAMLCGITAPALGVTPDYRVTSAFANSRYYTELSELELTGNYRADLINIALTQVGYHEGGSAGDRNGMNMKSDGNWTEYGYYCECDGFAWCAMFVSWCARQARIPQSLIANSRVARAPWFEVPFAYKENYTPAAGDIIFFAEKGEEWSHVGIVLGVNDTGVFTIEGNSRDMVRIKFYEFDDEYIKGYGNYKSEPCTVDMIQRKDIYKLRFDLNGGEGKRRDQYVTAGAAVNLYANAPDAVADDDELIEEPENNDWAWKDGYDFVGWYVQRDRDGRWLTESNGWRTADEIAQNRYQRKIYEDMDTVYIDESWGGEDFSSYAFYAAWKNQETGKYVDDSAFIVTYDSKGWANTFKDLSESDKYYSAAKDIISRGLINGISENIFGAESPLTRAQFLAMLYRYDGGKTVDAVIPYEDVKSGDWFYDAAVWACKNGVSPDTTRLRPNTPLTREEAVQYLYNYALLKGKAEAVSDKDITLDIVRTLLAFSDISVMSPGYLEAVLWTFGNGVLVPVEVEGRSMLRPKAIVNRAEACEMLSAWLSLE
ncbi:MAG: S-layer homology domain-containing protein [Clostridiales bacterium]|nr:S-layer homology domain-containing protein [Clostridiales bacterium]